MKPAATITNQSSNRCSDQSMSERTVKSHNTDSATNSFSEFAEGSLVVIENPMFTDSLFSQSNRSGDEIDLSKLLVANEE